MAQAYQCDRCGKFYTGPMYENINLKKYEIRYTNTNKFLDLCEKCTDDLRNFIDGKEEGA